jgi:hypothetical protein
MSIPRVTRDEFSAAVEAGVTSALDAGIIDFSQAAELRRFGREHVGLVATGNYYDAEHGCGCPLWQTRIHRPAGGNGRASTDSRLHRVAGRPLTGERFTTPYDALVLARIEADSVEVVA